MFSDRLREFRRKSGFSQEELARELNVVNQIISLWERGQAVPDAETLVRIAKVLNVTPSELLGENITNENDINEIARHLARINEEISMKNNTSRKLWNVVIAALIGIFILYVILVLMNFAIFEQFRRSYEVHTYSDIFRLLVGLNYFS